jgi:hypothetical protein
MRHLAQLVGYGSYILAVDDAWHPSCFAFCRGRAWKTCRALRLLLLLMFLRAPLCLALQAQ